MGWQFLTRPANPTRHDPKINEFELKNLTRQPVYNFNYFLRFLIYQQKGEKLIFLVVWRKTQSLFEL